MTLKESWPLRRKNGRRKKKRGATLAKSTVWASAAFLAGALGVGGGDFASTVRAQDATIEVGKVLVDDAVKGPKPELATGSFSVGLRFKLEAPGNEVGNGDGLGMLFSVASGWHDGFRAHYSWRTGQITFQIGRVKEKSAVSVGSERGFLPGVMRDVVAVYDAEKDEMSLYVDGENVGVASYSEPVDALDYPLSVGFAGFGVGSNRMFVDKLEYWKRPLTAREISERNAARPKAELEAAQALAFFVDAGNATNLAVDDSQIETILALDVPEETKATARRTALAKALNDNNFAKAAKLAFAEAERLLAEEKTSSDAESQAVRNARLSRCGEIELALTACSSTERCGAEVAAEATRLQQKLRKRFSDEWATFEEINALGNAAGAVQKIEKDAKRRYDATLKTLNAAKKRTIFVAPNGNDAADGSREKPVATLAKAFEIAQTWAKNANAQDGNAVVVELANGVYRVDRTAALDGVANVVVRPASGAKAVLTGAVEVDNFQTLSDGAKTSKAVADAASRFQETARSKIFVADLTDAGVEDCGRLATRGYGVGEKVAPIPSLYVDGESQTLARWPNVGDAALDFGDVVSQGEVNGKKTTTLRYDFDRPNGWKISGNADADDIWAFGLYVWEWAANFRRVEKIDRDAKTLTVDYPDANGRFHYYFVNVLEELDAPGEYYVDRNAGLLYFYAPDALSSVDALKAASVEFDVFDGRFVDVKNSRRIVLQNIELKGGRETAVAFENCVESYFVGGKIEQFGGNGALILNGEFCGVLDSRLRELGASGVRIRGGDRSTLKRANHWLSNCFISDFSRIDRVYAPALQFNGCGLAATNNLICDSPHHGMRTDGNDIYIARNEVHSVVYEYSDQSGIDIFCDPTFRGIVIEENLWRHIGSSFALCGQAGIRLDDTISGVAMIGNVFYRSSGGNFGGIQIHGGKDNLSVGNVFVDCKQAFSFSPWSDGRYRNFVKERFPENVGKQAFIDAYPFFDKIFENPNRNYFIGNDAINCGLFNRNGDGLNVFVGNTLRTVESPENVDAFLTDSAALRGWLEEVSGRKLDGIGLRANWNGAEAPVSPMFPTPQH
ncbi:MAG: hypothetical protein IJY15_01710 [Thermoguttaceae bacterium]|nr:hypothetical protein [Thermoguttaceae bacterium]